jgi:hypothetical protein
MDATKELEDFPTLAESSRRRIAVLRRCPTPSTMLASALAIGLGLLPISARGDALTSSSNTSNTATESLEYTLTTTQAIVAASGSPPTPGSSATTPQILAEVSPVSIVQPASVSASALQIFTDSTGYYINNPSQLSVEIGNVAGSDGSTIATQALGLSFFGQGLAANSSLTFSLPFSQSVVGNPPTTIPQFTVINPTTGATISTISIKFDGLAPGTTSVTSTGGGGSGMETAAPEPLSLLVWSVLAGAGLWRARSRRPYGPRFPLVTGK